MQLGESSAVLETAPGNRSRSGGRPERRERPPGAGAAWAPTAGPPTWRLRAARPGPASSGIPRLALPPAPGGVCDAGLEPPGPGSPYGDSVLCATAGGRFGTGDAPVPRASLSSAVPCHQCPPAVPWRGSCPRHCPALPVPVQPVQPLPCPEGCPWVWSGPAWHSHLPARRRRVPVPCSLCLLPCALAVPSCGCGAHAGVPRATAGCVVPGSAQWCRELPASSASSRRGMAFALRFPSGARPAQPASITVTFLPPPRPCLFVFPAHSSPASHGVLTLRIPSQPSPPPLITRS